MTEGVSNRFGKIACNAWIAWAKEQPDIAEHPQWLALWGDLPERDKEVYRRIAFEVFAETTLFLREREEQQTK